MAVAKVITDETKISKFMSLVLRHDPAALGVQLDENGWADFGDFTQRMNSKFGISADDVARMVENNPKKRFVIRDGKIRANQGHSIDVDLALELTQPPDLLYHGTTVKVLPNILSDGLVKGDRHHVHLSADIVTAEKVSVRRAPPWVVLKINASAMHRDSFAFYRSENGVWLTDSVKPAYLTILKEWTARGAKS